MTRMFPFYSLLQGASGLTPPLSSLLLDGEGQGDGEIPLN